MPTSFTVSFRRSDGQTAQIFLHQRLHRRQIEAADEDEDEVAGIGEAVLVEGQRLVEVHPIDARRRQRLRARMVLAHRGVERLI